MANKQMFVAVQSGSAEINGENRVFVRGFTIVDEDDALLKALPAEYFKVADGARGVHETTVISHTADATETTATTPPPAPPAAPTTPRRSRRGTAKKDA